jgi:hypothetical protein
MGHDPYPSARGPSLSTRARGRSIGFAFRGGTVKILAYPSELRYWVDPLDLIDKRKRLYRTLSKSGGHKTNVQDSPFMYMTFFICALIGGAKINSWFSPMSHCAIYTRGSLVSIN